MAGVNAAVVGLLASALYDPVWTGAVRGPADFAVAAAGFAALVAWRAPPVVVVLMTAAAGVVLGVALGACPSNANFELMEQSIVLLDLSVH